MNLFTAMQHVRLSLSPSLPPRVRDATLNRARLALFDLDEISPSTLSLVLSQINHDA